jgi:hypothetical protein
MNKPQEKRSLLPCSLKPGIKESEKNIEIRSKGINKKQSERTECAIMKNSNPSRL